MEILYYNVICHNKAPFMSELNNKNKQIIKK